MTDRTCTSSRSRLARLGVRGVAAALVLGAPLAAVPAYAAPVGWPEAPPVPLMHALLVFVFAPLGIALVLTLLVLAPSLARGEGLGRSPEEKEEWFGGPVEGSAEAEAIEGSEGETPEITGGASGRW